MGLSLKGCQIVAGGRSVAKTTGRQKKIFPTLEGCQKTVAPLQGADEVLLVSGGLRSAATTGYYLTAFQAGNQSLQLQVLITARALGASLQRRSVARII